VEKGDEGGGERRGGEGGGGGGERNRAEGGEGVHTISPHSRCNVCPRFEGQSICKTASMPFIVHSTDGLTRTQKL